MRVTRFPIEPGFEPERYVALLRALLGPSLRRRDAADTLLFHFLLWEPKDDRGLWCGRVAEAVEALGDEREAFLRALVSHWGDRSLAAHVAWMASCGYERAVPAERGWQHADAGAYPLDDPNEALEPGPLIGSNTGSLLAQLGPAAAACTEQLAACVAHPSGLAQAHATQALGAMGPSARAALPVLLARIRSGEADSDLPVAAARICGPDPAPADPLVRELDPRGELSRIDSVCGLLDRLEVASPAWSALLLAKLDEANDAEARARLLVTGATLARRTGEAADLWRLAARSFAKSPSATLRFAAAAALGEVGESPADDSLAIALANDPDPYVRCGAHEALPNRVAPPLETLRAAVRDLEAAEYPEEQPGSSALEGLVACGARLAPVLPELEAWIEGVTARIGEQDEWAALSCLELAEALGPLARGMRGALERIEALHRPRERGAEEPEPLEPDPEEEEEPDDGEIAIEASLELARELGFPIDRDVPGSPESGDLREDPADLHVRARRLLDRLVSP